MDDSPLTNHLADTVAALKHLLKAQVTGIPRFVAPPRPEPIAPPPPPPAPKPPTRSAPPPRPAASAPPAAAGGPIPGEDPWPGLDLAAIGELVSQCRRCDLAATRTRTVFGEGAMNPPVMFVGEGPGADEDQAGRPFVGAAGQLLDKMIVAMGLRREDCYIANVVKCRPPNNANPRPDQIEPCLPYLHAQIRRVKPRFLIALGATAAQTLVGRPDLSVGRLRGRIHRLGDIPLVVTYHPAALLRDPGLKRAAWEDLQRVMARLNTGED